MGQRGGGAVAGAAGESLPGAGPDGGSGEGSVGATRCRGGRVRARGVGKVFPVEAWLLFGFASWEGGERKIRKLGKVGKGDENSVPGDEWVLSGSGKIRGIGTAVTFLFSILSVNCVTCWKVPCQEEKWIVCNIDWKS